MWESPRARMNREIDPKCRGSFKQQKTTVKVLYVHRQIISEYGFNFSDYFTHYKSMLLIFKSIKPFNVFFKHFYIERLPLFRKCVCKAAYAEASQHADCLEVQWPRWGRQR